ncbi:UNVERIFIED_CONTAM: hypothetical protein HDU68_004664 [Siphonaria sp. JEL0065]|nr:hypothetical protein HDU68_004664 [Siphonaria sp. JEL0065]
MKAAVLAKKEAVKNENFRLANSLKVLVELTRKASEEVSKLLLLKAKSIELEDYELAEDAKADIEQIRDALDTKITELGLKQTSDDKIIPLDLRPSTQASSSSTNIKPHPPIQTPLTTMDLPKAALLERMRTDSIEAAKKREEEETKKKRELEDQLKKQEQEEDEAAKRKQSQILIQIGEPRIDGNGGQVVNSAEKPSKTLPAIAKRGKAALSPPQRPPFERVESTPILPNLSGYSLPNILDPTDVSTDLTSLGDPEPLNEELTEKYAMLIQVYGTFLAQCLLSRQFKLREEAVEEVIQRVDAWCTNNAATKKSKKDVEKGSPPVVAPVRQKVRVDWRTEVDAPDVDRETFIEATFMALERGLDDSRERAITLSLSLWGLLTKTCVSREIPKLLVFRCLDTLFPLLLLKSGHMNPRVKQGCLELVVTLAKAYHTIPHSVMKYILKPPKPTASPRYIIARLDALHLVLMKNGVDDMKQLDNAGSGLTIKSAMTFTEPQLHNKTTEIRESAVKVIIDLCLLVENDELIFSYLTNIKHQTRHIIQTRLELARHGKEVRKAKHHDSNGSLEAISSETLVDNADSATATSAMATASTVPHSRATAATPGKILPGLGKPPKSSSEAELVQTLKDEIEALKGIVQEKIAVAPVVEASSGASKKPTTVAAAAGRKKMGGATAVAPTASSAAKQKARVKSNGPTKTVTTTTAAASASSRPQTRTGKGDALKPVGKTVKSLEPVLDNNLVEDGNDQVVEEANDEEEANKQNELLSASTERSVKSLSPKKKEAVQRVSALSPHAPVKKKESYSDLKMTLTEERLANSWNRTCIFCNEKSPEFTDENLDVHYWRDCPMLCSCPLCHLIVEIPILTTHMTTECDNKKLVKQCSRCKECIMTTEFQGHVERGTCLAASVIPGVSRCPLCHVDVAHGESGWIAQLVNGGGCAGSNRDRRKGGGGLETGGGGSVRFEDDVEKGKSGDKTIEAVMKKSPTTAVVTATTSKKATVTGSNTKANKKQ